MPEQIHNYSEEDIHTILDQEQKKAEEDHWYNEELTIAIDKTLSNIDRKLFQYRHKLTIEENKAYQKEYQNITQELHEQVKDLNQWDYIRRNENILNTLALKINIFEDKMVEMIETRLALIEKDKKIDQETNNTVNNFYKRQADGSLKLTSATNKPDIQTVLQNLVKEGTYWKIDYKNCETASDNGRGGVIKQKMIKAISEYLGEEKTYCYITYGKDPVTQQMSYLLSDGKGNIIPTRAFVWDGVILTPAHHVEHIAQQEIKKRQNTIETPERAELIAKIPNNLRKQLEAQDLINIFLETAEKKLDQKVKELKEIGAIITDTPIESTAISNIDSFMKLNYIIPKTNTDIQEKPRYGGLWDVVKNTPNDIYMEDVLFKNMDPKLFKLLDNNESGFATFLNLRIHEKWDQLGDIRIKQDIGSKNESTNSIDLFTNDEALITSNGLHMMDNFFTKLITMFSDLSFFSAEKIVTGPFQALIRLKEQRQKNGTGDLAKLKKDIDNALYSIQKGTFTKSDLNKIKTNIRTIFDQITLSSETFGDIITPMNNILTPPASAGTTPEDIKKYQALQMRKLGNKFTRFDNTLTSEATRETTLEQEKLQAEKKEYSECMKKIENTFLTDTDFDPDTLKITNSAKKDLIDSFYTATNVIGIFNLLQNNTNQFIPKDAKFEDYSSICDQLFKSFQKKKKILNELEDPSTYRDSLKKIVQDYEAIPENQKTPEQLATMNKFEYLLENEQELKDFMEDFNKTTIFTIRYGSFGNTLKQSLFPKLIEDGGGLTGDDALLTDYNDSIGSSGFDFSDESTERATGFIDMVSEEAVYLILTIALSETGVGSVASGSALVARFTKRLGTGAKILSKIKRTKYLTKLATPGKILAEITTNGVSYQLTHTMFNNLLHGKTLNQGISIIEHPMEYAKSIAFLGVFKGIGKLREIGLQKLVNITSTKAGYEKLVTNLMASKIPTNLIKGSLLTVELGLDTGTALLVEEIFKCIEGENHTLNGEDVLQILTMAILSKTIGGNRNDNAWIKEFEAKGSKGNYNETLQASLGNLYFYEQLPKTHLGSQAGRLRESFPYLFRHIEGTIQVKNPNTGEVVTVTRKAFLEKSRATVKKIAEKRRLEEQKIKERDMFYHNITEFFKNKKTLTQGDLQYTGELITDNSGNITQLKLISSTKNSPNLQTTIEINVLKKININDGSTLGAYINKLQVGGGKKIKDILKRLYNYHSPTSQTPNTTSHQSSASDFAA